jgi:adenylate cyclase
MIRVVRRKAKRGGPAGSLRLRRLLLALVALGFTGLAVVAYEADLLRSLELTTVNTRFQIRGSRPQPRDVVLVEIDASTFDELDLQWPFPRGVHGRVIANIAREHPKAIAYDVQFTEATQCPLVTSGRQPAAGKCPQAVQDEESLLEALQGAGGTTVMSTTETNGRGDTRFLGSPEGTALLKEVGSRPANGLLPTDPGGALRRVSHSVGHLTTLAVATAEVAEHRRVPVSDFSGGAAWIDFYGPNGTFRHISFSQVYENRFPKGLFHGKIVVVGPSAPTLQDIHPTSTSPDMPGVEVQGNAIETVLQGLPLRSLPGWLDVLLILALGLAIPLVGLKAGPPLTIGVALGLAAVLTVGTQLAFDGGHVLPFVYMAGALVLTAAGTLTVQLVTIAFERERVRDLFSRFVPENVVDEVLATADGLRLGGVQREGTVMFTDLRGFTSFAETLTPDQVIEILNKYLSEMSDAILDHGGTLVAYMGDGIMAVFGAPIAQDDNADRALAAAREMLSVRLPRFNAWLAERGLSSQGFRMGIGLNSGPVMSGNVGSERRVEYTAVGDATNTAARIEQLTKGTPHQLMLSGATKDALLRPPEDFVFVEDVELRGRRSTTSIWSLPEDGESAPVQAPAAEEGVD